MAFLDLAVMPGRAEAGQELLERGSRRRRGPVGARRSARVTSSSCSARMSRSSATGSSVPCTAPRLRRRSSVVRDQACIGHRRLMVALAHPGAFALLSSQLERRLEMVHVRAHGFVRRARTEAAFRPS